MFVKQCSIHRSRAKYIWEKKQINYQFIPTSLFRGRPLIRGFPDELATTKQACRDELVVYVFSPIYSLLYFYVLSTVLQTSSFTLNIIKLFPEGEVNSGGYIPRREASRYISTALHRP